MKTAKTKRQFNRRRVRAVLNEDQEKALRSYRIEVKEVEAVGPGGQLMKVRHPVKVYLRLDEMKVKIKNLVPRPKQLG